MNIKLLKIKSFFLALTLIFLQVIESNMQLYFTDFFYIFGVLFVFLLDLTPNGNFYIIDFTFFSLIAILKNYYHIDLTNGILFILLVGYWITLINFQFEKIKIFCYITFFLSILIFLLKNFLR
ncbi:MAG: hypothetical protein ACLT40_13025 [Fusobacterium sp.]